MPQKLFLQMKIFNQTLDCQTLDTRREADVRHKIVRFQKYEKFKNMHNFKELKSWQKAIDFCLDIYKLTGQFPNEERFGLTSQLRRAGV